MILDWSYGATAQLETVWGGGIWTWSVGSPAGSGAAPPYNIAAGSVFSAGSRAGNVWHSGAIVGAVVASGAAAGEIL